MRSAIDVFVDGAEQFDDMTMLCTEYRGTNKKNNTKEAKTDMLTIDAVTDNLQAVTDFVNSRLEKFNCPPKALMQIDLAVEEIFVNIASYAYDNGTGKASVSVEMSEEPAAILITFSDSGKPYNPLEKADPDITLSADEREIGGFGIFMTKKAMDDVSYEYKNGHNILILTKKL